MHDVGRSSTTHSTSTVASPAPASTQTADRHHSIKSSSRHTDRYPLPRPRKPEIQSSPARWRIRDLTDHPRKGTARYSIEQCIPARTGFEGPAPKAPGGCVHVQSKVPRRSHRCPTRKSPKRSLQIACRESSSPTPLRDAPRNPVPGRLCESSPKRRPLGSTRRTGPSSPIRRSSRPAGYGRRVSAGACTGLIARKWRWSSVATRVTP